ncbi:Major tail protein [Vibrio crassostreae]|nr:conserved hypothetical protein [Vibrio chagasii]CAK1881529.1 Major tail protein [Vibrio crassostreae]CAK1883496.1 Major tail protein [Vibrio crassostreae]CAK2318297.1 Major tail protein [Vibrio crassostreae]CAK2601448.1 Major tail protein [Vibrio crassostreae]
MSSKEVKKVNGAKIASGSNLVLKRSKEPSFGSPGTDNLQQRFTTYTPTFTKNEVTDPTVNGNRQDTETRFTTRALSFSLEAVLSHEDQDDLIESAMWSTWSDTDEDGERVIGIGSPAQMSSYTFEAHQTDINTQRRFTGLTVNSMTITSPLDGNTTVSYEMLGQEEVKASTPWGDPDPYANTQSYTHIDGEIDFAGITDCIVQSFDMTITNNAAADFCWGERGAHSITEANVEVTGNLTLFYINSVINDMYLDDTEGSLNVILKNEEGHEFELDFPRIQATGADNPFAAGQRVVTLPFRALAAKDGSFDALTIKARGYTDVPEPPAE